MNATPLREEDTLWLDRYRTNVVDTFSSHFKAEETRFPGWMPIVECFAKRIDNVLSVGRSAFAAVDEIHNEICIAEALLNNTKPYFVAIDYEPTLEGCSQTIDFRAETDDGLTAFVDVKTIKPLSKDRWDQFEKARQEGWLSENVQLLLSEAWLGGELWHSMFAARSRMLEYSIELERKITKGNLARDNISSILAFCGDGFKWHESELEDFVHFYFSGSHRSDDPFADVEQHFIAEQKIALDRNIMHFACMCRLQGEIRPKRLNWAVRPPAEPHLEMY